jgi:translation initiation factor 2 beta subunit (eIF-2beta)/eIF-5
MAARCPVCGSTDMEYVYAFEQVARLKCANCVDVWWGYG